MPFKKSLLIVSFALAAMLAACGGAPSSSSASPPASSSAVEKAEYRTLTAQEAKARMDSGDSIVVLDVRTEAEFEEKHIEGAVLIPNETIISEPPAELPDKDAEILIYCRSGNRSRQAAEKLIGMGYSNVYDFGGINSWPYDTVSGKAEK
ncbi:MAG: rhodanese-like domain-containing protein [Pygmaiobacter massiliensis]|nr:rhodanese-like domain-containing protein [Pygmaiobacter massiliensis]